MKKLSLVCILFLGLNLPVLCSSEQANQATVHEKHINYSKLMPARGIASILLGLAGAYILTTKKLALKEKIMASIMSPILTLGGAYMLKEYCTPGHYITLNEQGITTREHGFTPWQNIRVMFIQKTGDTKSIMFVRMDDTHFCVSDNGLDTSAQDIVAAISTFKSVLYYNGAYLVLANVAL